MIAEIETQVAPAVAPPVRKCRIEEAISGNLLELLRIAPLNPLVRGLVLSQTQNMPPDDCRDFDQLKDWIEINCDKRTFIVSTRNQRARRGALSIRVDFSENEYGRANYTVRRSGSEQFVITSEELLPKVQDCIGDGGFDALVELIREEINDNAWDRCDPCLDDYGDYDYGEHDCDDTGNSRVEFSDGEIRNQLNQYLRQHHPDLLDQL